ncbi:MAG: hypothetical protein A2V66_09950 [Ignavibacteria bacterium RBG_13_36_8]|nr:MAG: hypothetical protein A2V66_09950 [Ignavibacteria bacterium RBG_13_36_8]
MRKVKLVFLIWPPYLVIITYISKKRVITRQQTKLLTEQSAPMLLYFFKSIFLPILLLPIQINYFRFSHYPSKGKQLCTGNNG